MKFSIFLSLLFLILIGKSFEITDLEYYDVVDGINDFSYKMSSQMDLNNNIIYSPLSISIATGMLLAGASGETKNEICTAFKSRQKISLDILTRSYIKQSRENDDLENCYQYDENYHTAVSNVSKNKFVTYNQIDN